MTREQRIAKMPPEIRSVIAEAQRTEKPKLTTNHRYVEQAQIYAEIARLRSFGLCYADIAHTLMIHKKSVSDILQRKYGDTAAEPRIGNVMPEGNFITPHVYRKPRRVFDRTALIASLMARSEQRIAA